MSGDAWIAVILATVGLLAVYFLPREARKGLKARSMRRCAQDAELAQVRHGRSE